MNERVLEVTKFFISELKHSPEYREYELKLEKIKAQPELHARVNEFRKRNFEIQSNEAPEHLMDRLEALEQEYADILGLSPVEGFLVAELAYCRMIQEVVGLIVEETDFQ